MESLQTCSLTESDFIPQRDTEGAELFEDASSNADWIDVFSDSDTHTTCSLLGDYNRPIDLLDDLYEKNKILERKWQDAEKKYQNILLEIQKQNLNLCNEKERANRFQKKLQYIQSNCVMLNHLKENYLESMTFQENDKNKMQECFAQTDSSEAKNGQPKTDQLQEYKKVCTYAKSENIVAVKRSELQLMKATLEKLKVMVDQKSSINGQEDDRVETNRLHNTISILNDTVSKKNYEINSLKLLVCDGKKLEVVEKENTAMKRIIMKMEKRQREIEKVCKPFRSIPILTEDERTIVQSIFKRCGLPKVKKFSRSLSCDVSNHINIKNTPPFITASCKEQMLFFNIPNNNRQSNYARTDEPERS